MDFDKENLREKLHELAQSAFEQRLISGHGDGENPNEYQITYQGKPRHLTLKQAYDFLTDLVRQRAEEPAVAHYFHSHQS
jgi:hypothetical protein